MKDERVRSQRSPDLIRSGRPKPFENLRRDAGAFMSQTGEDVVDGDEWVFLALRFCVGDLEGFGGAGCEGKTG